VRGFANAAVVEEDSSSPAESATTGAALTSGDLNLFATSLTRNDWSFLRLGWRQYTLEIAPAGDCPVGLCTS
jgi:hypothetical protein